MNSRNISTKFGRKSNASIAKDMRFLAHENEPIDNHKTYTPDEIRQELYESHSSVKRREWRKYERFPAGSFK